MRLTTAAAALVLATTTATARAADEDHVFKEGEQVLAVRNGTGAMFPATLSHLVADVDLDNPNAVTFADGTEQKYGPITWPTQVKPFDWKVGQDNIECAADAKTLATEASGSAQLTTGTISAIDATNLELTTADKKKTKFAIASCRQHLTWWDGMSDRWRNYATYKKVAAMPRAKAKDPSPDEISSAFSYELSGDDGGSYIQIKKCVATGASWIKMTSGDELTARTIDVACAIAVPLPPKPKENFTCLVEYGVCRQAYQGDGEYAGCEWHWAGPEPTQIDCKLAK
jgi:hypothetical protein